MQPIQQVQKDRVFESAEQMAAVSADELANMVKDKDDPTKINLEHSAFKHGRRHFEDILSSPNFANIDQTERMKLFLNAEKERKDYTLKTQQKEDGTSFVKDLDAVSFKKPLLKFHGEAKARVREGCNEFICLASIKHSVSMSFEEDDSAEVIDDRTKFIQVGGREEDKETFELLIYRQNPGATHKQLLSSIEIPGRPLPFAAGVGAYAGNRIADIAS